MNVLSLFDGIGCGRIALDRAGIQVDSYYASEIEKSAITIAITNYPTIIEIGDVTKVFYHNGILTTEKGVFNVGHIDLLMGGSPCTDFSSVGYANGMTSEKAEILSLDQYLTLKNQGAKFDGQSYLFWEYVRLFKEINPDYFLLENVVMANKWRKIINGAIGIQPILINSSLMSAQNRPRLYWTNIDGVSAPADKGIHLQNILDGNASKNDVSGCQTVQRSFSKLMKKYGYVPKMFNAYNAAEIKNKACALSRGSMVTSSCATLIFVACDDGKHIVQNGILNETYPVKFCDGRYNLRRLNILEMERLQTMPDNYTDVVGIGLQKRSAAIGNGWTVDIIAHILSNIK